MSGEPERILTTTAPHVGDQAVRRQAQVAYGLQEHLWAAWRHALVEARGEPSIHLAEESTAQCHPRSLSAVP